MGGARERSRTLRIGQRLRAIRRERGLSLRALAARVGFSPSFVSQVELDQVSPSLGSLDRIAASLGTSLAALLSRTDDRPTRYVRRKGSPGIRSGWSRATADSLLPAGADGGASAVLIALERGGRMGTRPTPLDGYELVFCHRGRIAAELGDERVVLAEGDSVFYDAALSVAWSNASPRRAAALLLVSLRRALAVTGRAKPGR